MQIELETEHLNVINAALRQAGQAHEKAAETHRAAFRFTDMNNANEFASACFRIARYLEDQEKRLSRRH